MIIIGCHRVSSGKPNIWAHANIQEHSGGAIAGWVSQYIGRRLTIMYVALVHLCQKNLLTSVLAYSSASLEVRVVVASRHRIIEPT